MIVILTEEASHAGLLGNRHSPIVDRLRAWSRLDGFVVSGQKGFEKIHS